MGAFFIHKFKETFTISIQLSPEEQRKLFEDRGIIFPNNTHEKDAQKIQEIGYYKLKEFAHPFSSISNNCITYKKLNFSTLLKRYYQDKNLRLYILHAVEDIEVNINNQISTILGKKLGAFGYLNFKDWSNKKINKFEIEKQQYFFKKDLLHMIHKSTMESLKHRENKNDEGFPSVWIMVNLLTFGETIKLISLMSKNNQNLLAKKYNCKSKELISWLKCLNLIRNICAHNSNIIDIKLKTPPKIPQEYSEFLKKEKNEYSKSLALILFIVKRLMDNVNSGYSFRNIYSSLRNMSDGNSETLIEFGFIDRKVIKIFK